MPYFERNLTRGKRLAWGEKNDVEESVEEGMKIQTDEFYTMTSEGFPNYRLNGVGFGGGTKTV